MDITSFRNLSDIELLSEVTRLVASERAATARLIASLGELDSRQLYLGQGCSSLFTYCTQVLRLSEHAAYNRIEAARRARRFPVILERLADGSITLTTVNLLGPYLDADNHVAILDEARHKSKREVEQLVARLNPRPDVVASVRKLPASKPQVILCPGSPPAPSLGASALVPGDQQRVDSGETPRVASHTVVTPLAPARYKLQLTMTAETYEKLRKAQDLLRHAIPSGDPALIVDRALTLLVEDVERRKVGAAARPRRACATRPGSRHVPAAVKREVWRRDGGRCAFVGPHGRCTETSFLEYHHVVPFAAGGQATVENISLRCGRHNGYEYDVYAGSASLLRERRADYLVATRSGTSMSRLENFQSGSGDICAHTGVFLRLVRVVDCGTHHRRVSLARAPI